MATRRVVGSWKVAGPNGARTPGKGTVTFTPSSVLFDSVLKEILVQDPIVAKLSDQGEIDVDLQVTGEENLRPAGWFWNVDERVSGRPARSYELKLPYSLDPYNLSSVNLPATTKPIGD